VKKAIISLTTGAAMVLASLSAFAADGVGTQSSSASGPLTPAGAAGVQQAEGINDVPVIWLAGAAVVVAIGALALSNNGGGGNSSPSTTTTTTTTSTTTTGS
jgi:hypothetical protein